ncbi:MAG TPA: hypothetical protein VL992_20905 [Tepidisphaeraceae bacterium]|nr:hypothetical protein [Tepidisphaeraceae bacterium]
MNQGIVRGFLLVLAVAVGLRMLTWPGRYEVRNIDEVGYLDSSLVLVEDIPPGFKPAPGGPLIWLGWAYAESQIARAFFHPSVARLPLQLRPFFAMNKGLFDLYRDLSGMRRLIIVANFLLLIAALAAGFDYGRRRAGWPGAVVIGGLIAVLPIFVQFSEMSRPYSMAWSFGILAIDAAAACTGRRRVAAAAILCGLAIGSRIEMICLLPWVLWEFWDRREARNLAVVWLKLILGSLATAYFVAPWLLTGLPGNLRAIATIQLANPSAAAVRTAWILKDFFGTQGFAIASLVILAGMPLWALRQDRFRRGALAIFVLLLACSILKTTGFGLYQKGPSVVAIILACGISIGEIHSRWPKWTAAIIALILLLPLVRTAMWAWNLPPNAAPAADWVEAHVPRGSVVYDRALLKVPLPTPQAADAIWEDVTAPDSWKRKFASGLSRFGLSSDELPRAMSEENMVQERGNMRRWFILGSAAGDTTSPRYVFRPLVSSPVFGVQNISAEFAKTGGVVIWRPSLDGAPPAEWGNPITSLPSADGTGALVFCSSDLRPRIKGISH